MTPRSGSCLEGSARKNLARNSPVVGIREGSAGSGEGGGRGDARQDGAARHGHLEGAGAREEADEELEEAEHGCFAGRGSVSPSARDDVF